MDKKLLLNFADLIIKHSPLGIAVFDTKMNYIHVSRMWLDMFELENDIIGQSHYLLFPNMRQDWIENHEKALKGESVPHHEDVHTKRDGTHNWIRWSIEPWGDKAGTVKGIVIFIQDISAEKALIESYREEEKKFKAIFDQAAIGICQVNSEGYFQSINQRFCELVEFTEDELILKKTYMDLTHPEDLEKDVLLATSVLKNEIPRYEIDKRYITKTGKIIWVHLTVSMVRDKNDQPKFFVSTVQDITSKKNIEDTLKQSQKELDQKVKERTAYLSFLQKIASEANQSENIADSLSLSLKEICELTKWEIGHFSPPFSTNLAHLGLKHLWEVQCPEKYQNFIDATYTMNKNHDSILALILKTGKPFWSNDIFYEYNFHRSESAKKSGIKSGMAFPVLVGTEVVGILEFFSTKNIHPNHSLMDLMVQAGVQLGRLIERQIAKEQIKLSQSRLQAIIDNIPARIFLKDEQGKYLIVNRTFEDFFDLKIENILGKTAFEVFSKNDAIKFTQMDQEILSQGKIISQEIEIESGKKCNLLLIKFPVIDHNNRIYGLGGISIDITEEKQNKLKMQKLLESEHHARTMAEKAITDRDEFISIASHELKSPISSIKLKIQLLIRQLANQQEVDVNKLTTNLKKLDSDAERLVLLINRLLDLTRIQSGHFELNYDKVNINDLIYNILDSQFSSDKMPTIQFISTETIWGNWDQSRMEQVVVNLVSNAIKFGNNLPIRISTNINDDKLILEITDQGIGISSENLCRIFERFERGSVQGNIQGLGLGLYIVKQIIEAHGGTIKVMSATNTGTTFRVEIPLNLNRDIRLIDRSSRFGEKSLGSSL